MKEGKRPKKPKEPTGTILLVQPRVFTRQIGTIATPFYIDGMKGIWPCCQGCRPPGRLFGALLGEVSLL